MKRLISNAGHIYSWHGAKWNQVTIKLVGYQTIIVIWHRVHKSKIIPGQFSHPEGEKKFWQKMHYLSCIQLNSVMSFYNCKNMPLRLQILIRYYRLLIWISNISVNYWPDNTITHHIYHRDFRLFYTIRNFCALNLKYECLITMYAFHVVYGCFDG